MGDGHPQKGQSPAVCKALANIGMGASSYDAFGAACWAVYGLAIQINPIMNSIKQGAMITNINFHTKANPPPVAKTADINGPTGATIGAAIQNLGV